MDMQEISNVGLRIVCSMDEDDVVFRCNLVSLNGKR